MAFFFRNNNEARGGGEKYGLIKLEKLFRAKYHSFGLAIIYCSQSMRESLLF
jgi:hypothetical protein